MSLGDGQFGVGLGEEVDEEGGDTDLGTNIAELSGDTEEESVLLAERLVDISGSRGHHLSLVGHIRVSDLGDGCEVEDDGQDTDEDGDTKVNPLNSLKTLAIGPDILEYHERSKNRCDDGADSLERLGKLETELSPLGGTANRNVGVGGGFQRRQARADNEHGATETTEASLDSGRPEHKSPHAVDPQSEHESVAVAESAQEPSGVGKRTDEVGTEVGGLKTGRLSLSDVQSNLEAGVEDIEKTIGETPEEEEECDHGNGNDGLPGSQLRSTSDDAVVNALATDILVDDLNSRGTAGLLLVDLVQSRLLGAVKSENHYKRFWNVKIG